MRGKYARKLGGRMWGFLAVNKMSRVFSDLQWAHILVRVDDQTLPQELEVKLGGSCLKIQLWWEIPPVLNLLPKNYSQEIARAKRREEEEEEPCTMGGVEEGMDSVFTKVLQAKHVEISAAEVLMDPTATLDPMVEEFHESPCLPGRVPISDGLVPMGMGPRLDLKGSSPFLTMSQGVEEVDLMGFSNGPLFSLFELDQAHGQQEKAFELLLPPSVSNERYEKSPFFSPIVFG